MIRSILDRQANQYARSYAHLPLAQVLAEHYSSTLSTTIDPMTMVATGVGATQVIFCALQGLVNPGDEVILFEPAFDIYASQVQMAGGIPVYVPLRQQENHNNGSYGHSNQTFQLNLQELESAITSRTKIILFNSPHNPTGKMFTLEEMEGIAKVIKQHPNNNSLVVLSDEVYEHIVFDDGPERKHVSFASLPGMFDRTLTISSAGKTFSCTGWKVGWAVGTPGLVKAVVAAQQWVTFSAPTPTQDAIAQCLVEARHQPYQLDDDHTQYFPGDYYAYLASEYQRKRDILADALQNAGMVPIVPAGGFFIMADTSHIHVPQSYLNEVTEAMPCHPMPRDWALSRFLTKEVGVTAIPPSAFYQKSNIYLAANLLRFAFCKSDETLLEARTRLENYFGR